MKQSLTATSLKKKKVLHKNILVKLSTPGDKAVKYISLLSVLRHWPVTSPAQSLYGSVAPQWPVQTKDQLLFYDKEYPVIILHRI